MCVCVRVCECFFNHLRVLHTSVLLMVFHLSLSDNKSPQVFRTLLSILADIRNDIAYSGRLLLLLLLFPP